VIVTDTSIEILDRVYFRDRSDEIRPESLPIVEAIGATLVGNPSILKIEVAGHAASNEPDAWGLAARGGCCVACPEAVKPMARCTAVGRS
jgi:hypothetical protein